MENYVIMMMPGVLYFGVGFARMQTRDVRTQTDIISSEVYILKDNIQIRMVDER